MEKILVLMSTYNGDLFLKEQIESILAQQDVTVSILVRDDGSTDNTCAILEDYQKGGALHYFKGQNIGPQHSFMHLLQHAPKYEYYAFADQDDIWLPDKLQTGIRSIKTNGNLPVLYFSQTQLVDENKSPLRDVIITPRLTFGESLIYKFIGGCTMVFNHELRQSVGNFLPNYLPMHDIWIYSIAQAKNCLVQFDPTPHILYRQHMHNVVGQGHGWLYDWKHRLRRFLKRKNERYLQALGLADGYMKDMPSDNAKLLKLFLDGKHSFLKRLSILRNEDLRCSDRTTQLLFWIHVILNRY